MASGGGVSEEKVKYCVEKMSSCRPGQGVRDSRSDKHSIRVTAKGPVM